MSSGLINKEAPESKTVFALIERFKEDEKAAVICGSDKISYRDFILSYRNFGLELVRSGLRKGDRVLVCKKRGIGWLTSVFGIMAAGGIYIPVDREWPSERRDFIMKDSGAALMVTDDGICGADGSSVPSSTDYTACSGTADTCKLPEVTGEDCCWIYYTSGSTGIPKGAANVHEVMYNNAVVCPENIYTACTVSSCTNVLAMLNLAYSFSLADVLISLCNGLTLILATEEERQDPSALALTMQKWQVEALASTPSLLERFLENEQFSSAFKKLRRVGLSGEGLSHSQMELIAGKTDGKLFNGYGSSEMLHCSDALCRAGEDITAGIPNLDVRLIVLRDDMSEAEPGEEGELLIGGAPAKHAFYFGREDLNSEKYILHPQFGRLFKTGDGAKVLENGVVKITGRKDGVMKLHGQRLDPGEIEQIMEQYPGVRKGAVHIQGEGASAVLCGFYTCRDNVDPAELRKWLSKRLPYYMIPVLFKELEELPLNTNGKLDRKSLPYIEETVERALYEAPSSEEEAVLCELFMDVLGEGLSVGAGDSFFDLGGDSILGMRIVSEARERGWKLELPALFASPVVRDLALTLKPTHKTADTVSTDIGVLKDKLSDAEKAAVTGKVSWDKVQAVYPLLPAMKNHLLYREGREWDAAEMLNIKKPVDIINLRERLAYLTTKRAALRTFLVFPENGRPLSVVRADASNTLEYLDLEYLADTDCSSEDAEAQITRYGAKVSDRQREYIRSHVDDVRGRSITDGKPGALIGIIKLGPENMIIYVIFSHYVLDGTGAHRIAEELLGDMPVSDDLENVSRYYQILASDSRMDGSQKYWSAVTEGKGYTKLPVKADAPSQESQSMRMRRFPMDRILAYGKAHQVTAAAIIHYAVGMALSKVTGSDRVCFSTIGNGREEQLTEDERLTGAFSSEMPVVYKKGDSIEDIQRQLLTGRSYNVFDFELLGEHFSGEESITGTVRCDILNFPEAEGTGPAAYNIVSDQFLYIPEDSLKDILLYFVLRDDLMMTCEFYPKYADTGAVSRLCRGFAEVVNGLV